MNYNKRSVVITGASAGIGRALAFEFARQGYHLGLVARRLERLESLKAEILAACAKKGASAGTRAGGDAAIKVDIAICDVNETELVPATLQALFRKMGKVDIVVVNAGINDFSRSGNGQFSIDQRIIQTNLIGAMATADAAVEYFRQQGGGHVVGISSLASLKGIPKQAAYCASKAGFSIYLESIGFELANKNIRVTTILPGFVETEIMEEISQYPFSISAEKAAKAMVRDIEKEKKTSVVPAYPWRLISPLMRVIPDSLYAKLG